MTRHTFTGMRELFQRLDARAVHLPETSIIGRIMAWLTTPMS
jgi:hypothetical protein